MDKFQAFECLNKLGIKNAFIGRPYDFSSENENRISDIAKLLDIEEDKIFQANQTHSTNIAIIKEDDNNSNYKFNNVDGLITNVKGTALLIKVADCQGIFLYDPVNKVIGNIHSGWKGTVDKIIIKAVDKMVSEFGTNKENIVVCINPCIKECHFEIEDNVLNEYKDKIGDLINDYLVVGDIKNGKQKYYLNLMNLNKKLLINHGLKECNIYLSSNCTVCKSDKYYSYRKDKTAKRNGCVIVL